MRSLFILILLIIMIILAIGYLRANLSCPPPVTDFRYVEQTFEETQKLPKPALSIFQSMFQGPDAWLQTDNFNKQGLAGTK